MSTLKDSLKDLYNLQLIDNEIIENLRHLKQLQNFESETHKKFLEYQAMREKVYDEIKPLKDHAAEIKDENTGYLEKKRNCEDRLFNADTDPRDLQFLQKEREQFINLIKKNEDELVRLMVKADTAEIKRSEYEEKMKELEPEFNRELEKRKATIEKLTSRVEELKPLRQAYGKFEDKKLMAKYQRLQKENAGLAIVTVVDGVCEGCFVEVPKSTMILIDDYEELVTCQRCGRILYRSEAASISA
jgi:uncharacterized protein